MYVHMRHICPAQCKYHMPLTMCDAYASHVRTLSQDAPHMPHTVHALRASLALRVVCMHDCYLCGIRCAVSMSTKTCNVYSSKQAKYTLSYCDEYWASCTASGAN